MRLHRQLTEAAHAGQADEEAEFLRQLTKRAAAWSDDHGYPPTTNT
ncbi:hypothetical protein [Streptomyces sp. NBC_00212]